jgi:hypothetical protein
MVKHILHIIFCIMKTLSNEPGEFMMRIADGRFAHHHHEHAEEPA